MGTVPAMALSLADWKRLHANDSIDTDDLLKPLREVRAADPDGYSATWLPYLATLTWTTRRPADQWFRPSRISKTLEALEDNAQTFPFLVQTFELEVAAKPKRKQLLDKLIASPWLAHVGELVLTDQKIGDAALASLLGAKPVKLRTLRIGGCEIGSGLTDLASASPLLTALDISDNRLDAKLLDKLMKSPLGQGLVELDVSSNALDRKSLAAIASGPALKTLRLANTDLDDAGVKALIAALAGSLETLELHHNDLTATGAKAIASADRLAGLRQLALFDNGIGDKGAEAIAAPTFLRLESLDVGKNQITKVGATALANSVHLGALEALYLDSNAIGNAGVAALAATKLRKLRKLSLGSAKITDPSPLAALELAELRLHGNKVAPAARTALDAVASRKRRIFWT
jgi:Leucine-rich repeat (LRR) protein